MCYPLSTIFTEHLWNVTQSSQAFISPHSPSSLQGVSLFLLLGMWGVTGQDNAKTAFIITLHRSYNCFNNDLNTRTGRLSYNMLQASVPYITHTSFSLTIQTHRNLFQFPTMGLFIVSSALSGISHDWYAKQRSFFPLSEKPNRLKILKIPSLRQWPTLDVYCSQTGCDDNAMNIENTEWNLNDVDIFSLNKTCHVRYLPISNKH